MKFNLNLLINLALFGLLAGILNVLGLFINYLWIIWLFFYVFGGLVLAKKNKEKLLLSAFICGFLFALFVYGAEVFAFPMYMENNPAIKDQLLNLPEGVAPRTYLLSMGLLIGVVNGAVMSCFTMGFSKFRNKEK